jgi:L-alanine-DL-glutamate epimerase-like enolase superfamily enzyme
MGIESIQPSVLEIPFKVAFRHASAERSAMQSLWVEARGADGIAGFGEGCPREYVTGESLASAQAFVRQGRGHWIGSIRDIESLRAHVDESREAIDANPAAWSAVEIALLDVFGKASGLAFESLLGVPAPGAPLRYSAVLGDASPAAFEAQLLHYLKAGFRDFKIKLSGDFRRDAAKVKALAAAAIDPRSVRADANNLFPTAAEAIAHFAALKYPFLAIEEPLPAGDYDGMRQIARALDARIILDETALRVGQLSEIRDDAHRWIVNLRISKMGGMMRSIEFARAAERCGVALIVGAHVGETSVLTRAAIAVANLARPILVAQEGAFGTHLLERDVVEPPLMFGAGGMLEVAGRFPGAGLGLSVRNPAMSALPSS